MRVDSFLKESARRWPDKTALVVGEARVSFAELETMAARIANLLHEHGVERNDRVVLFLESSVVAVASIFATLKAGAVFSPINASAKSGKLAYILNHCRAKGVITQANLLPVAAEAISQSSSVVLTLVADGAEPVSVRGGVALREALATAPARDILHGGIDLDLAMLIYTSGSTGFPKGVMMTHRNIVTAAISITTYLENTDEDVILNVLPLSFDYGLYQVLMGAKVGATVILEKSFAYPAAVLKTMGREGATGLPLVPTMAAVLLQLRDLDPARMPRLRYITNTAASLPPAHIQRLQELFPTARIYSMYGLTECKRCTYLPPEQLTLRPESVGKAIPDTEVYLIDEQGNRLGPGQAGELVIRGGHVMKGYWEDPQATERSLRPGPYPWEKVLHSGDLFRQDEEGYLYFLGRKDDIIKTRGEKVSPKEIENVLYALPGVREAAVIGVPDPILGQAIKALIAPAEEGSLTEQQVLRHCARHLEDFLIPRTVEFVSEFPKTDSGKIRRAEVPVEGSARGQA